MHIPALALALALDFAVAAALFFLLACFLFGVIFLPPAHQFFPNVLSGPLLTRFTGIVGYPKVAQSHHHGV